MADAQHDDQAHDDEVRGDEPAGGRPRRRTRNQGRRGRTVRFALTDAEYAELSDAARRAGLARGAFAAEAALSVALGVVMTPDAPLRDAFHALDRAALLVRKIGVNLNQAVAKLNATGQWSGDLVPLRSGERPPRGPAGGGRGRPAEEIPPGHPRTQTARTAIHGSSRRPGMTRWHPRSGPDGIPRGPSPWPEQPEWPEWNRWRPPWPGPRGMGGPPTRWREGVGTAFFHAAFFHVAG